MSVINKMLRDLDHRQAPEPGASTAKSAQGPRHGTVSVSPGMDSAQAKDPSRSSWRLWVVALCSVLALAGTAGGLWQAGYLDVPPVQVAVAPAPAAPLPAPVVVQAPAVEPVASAPAEPVAEPSPVAPVSPATVVLRMDSSLNLRQLLETELAPVSVKAKAPIPERTVSKPAPIASPAKVPTAVPTPPPDATQVAQRQQQAVKDAIAHAQSLWNAGSRDAAIELMQEVVTSSERTVSSAATPGNAQLLVLPVREFTRMLLAESRPGPVLELLTRLEPLLGKQADLWAVRANAAQRLGRHQDSVHAYMTALQLRPGEQRWLLGAAVSLAALGQTASAADMAEKARAVGVVSKDVLAYLRQMGVQIKD